MSMFESDSVNARICECVYVTLCVCVCVCHMCVCVFANGGLKTCYGIVIQLDVKIHHLPEYSLSDSIVCVCVCVSHVCVCVFANGGLKTCYGIVIQLDVKIHHLPEYSLSDSIVCVCVCVCVCVDRCAYNCKKESSCADLIVSNCLESRFSSYTILVEKKHVFTEILLLMRFMYCIVTHFVLVIIMCCRDMLLTLSPPAVRTQ
jgi:hypothetical protein